MKLQLLNRSVDKMRVNLMYVGIITVVTIVVWVSVSIYTSYSKPSIDPEILEVIKPINPSLDNQVLLNYSTSRIRPPEQFQIISIIKEGNQTTETLLDPYAIGGSKSRVVETPTSSESAEPTDEEIIYEEEIDPDVEVIEEE